MESQFSSIRKSCYAQLRMIGQIRSCLTVKTTETLVRNLVISRLDYCNSLLISIPDYLIHKLQLLQNNAARLVYRLRKYDHITPALISLHWLPITMRPRFKMCLLVFKCFRRSAPDYLFDLLEIQEPQRSLRSGRDTRLLTVPRSSSKLGERAFSISAPMVWNTLPFTLRQIDSVQVFKKELKNHFFVLAYMNTDLL